MAKVTLSSKHQITLPVDMVRELGLKPGDKLIATLIGDQIVLLPEPENWTEYFGGIARGVYGSTDEEIDAYIEGERHSNHRLEWKREFEELVNSDSDVQRIVKAFRGRIRSPWSAEELEELTSLDKQTVGHALEKLINHGSVRQSLVIPPGKEGKGKLYYLVRDFMKSGNKS